MRVHLRHFHLVRGSNSAPHCVCSLLCLCQAWRGRCAGASRTPPPQSASRRARLEAWLGRELQALLHTPDTALVAMFVLGVLAAEQQHDGAPGAAGPPPRAGAGQRVPPVQALQPFLQEHSEHFWHELRRVAPVLGRWACCCWLGAVGECGQDCVRMGMCMPPTLYLPCAEQPGFWAACVQQGMKVFVLCRFNHLFRACSQRSFTFAADVAHGISDFVARLLTSLRIVQHAILACVCIVA